MCDSTPVPAQHQEDLACRDGVRSPCCTARNKQAKPGSTGVDFTSKMAPRPSENHHGGLVSLGVARKDAWGGHCSTPKQTHKGTVGDKSGPNSRSA